MDDSNRKTIFELDAGRSHQPAAGVHPVSGDIVHMLAPETVGTVIRIAATGDLSPAVLADEILLFFDKVFPLHPFIIRVSSRYDIICY